MAKKKAKPQAHLDPYAIGLGLIQEAKEDNKKTSKAGKHLASMMLTATPEVRKVLNESCSALLAGEYAKAEFHLTHLMRGK